MIDDYNYGIVEFIIIFTRVPPRQRDVISAIFLLRALSLSFQELSFSVKMWEEGRSSAQKSIFSLEAHRGRLMVISDKSKMHPSDKYLSKERAGNQKYFQRDGCLLYNIRYFLIFVGYIIFLKIFSKIKNVSNNDI